MVQVSTKRLGDMGLERVTFGVHVRVKWRKYSKRCMGLRSNITCDHSNSQREYRHDRVKLPYLGNMITLPGGPSYPTEVRQLPYLY